MMLTYIWCGLLSLISLAIAAVVFYGCLLVVDKILDLKTSLREFLDKLRKK